MAVVLVGTSAFPEVLLAAPAATGGMAQHGVMRLVLLSMQHAACIAAGIFKIWPVAYIV